MPLDPDDIPRLYRLHARSLLMFFARRTHDAEAAVDLVAETFASALASRRQFRGESEEQAIGWVYGIARNQLNAYFRSGRIEQRAVQRLGMEHRGLTDEEYERIEDLAGLADLRARVADRLTELPADHQLILSMRVIEERSYAEIARVLEITQQTARARVSRALRALADGMDIDEAFGEVGDRV